MAKQVTSGFLKIFLEDIFVIVNRRKDFIFSLIGTNTKTTFNDAHFIYENSARAWFKHNDFMILCSIYHNFLIPELIMVY